MLTYPHNLLYAIGSRLHNCSPYNMKNHSLPPKPNFLSAALHVYVCVCVSVCMIAKQLEKGWCIFTKHGGQIKYMYQGKINFEWSRSKIKFTLSETDFTKHLAERISRHYTLKGEGNWGGAKSYREDYTIFLRNLHIFFCTCHNLFPLSSVQIIIIPACCLLCVL